MFPEVIILGECDPFTQEIKDHFFGKFNVKNYSKTNFSAININYSNTVAIFICIDDHDINTDIEIIKKLDESIIEIPRIAILHNKINREILYKIYSFGIFGHINFPKDELDYKIVETKLESIFKLYISRQKIEQDKKNILSNMKTYTNLLCSINIGYAIIDGNGIIIEINNKLKEMINDDAIGKKIDEFILKSHIENFYVVWEKIINGEKIEDTEINIINNVSKNSSSWVVINGSIIDLMGKKIFMIFKDISEKKQKNYRKYIEIQKNKDMIVQNINILRRQLKKW